MKNIYFVGRQFVSSPGRVGIYLLTSFALLLLSGCRQSVPSSPMGICISTATDVARIRGLDIVSIQAKCDCVQAKRNGVLPAKASEWGTWGKDAAKLSLIECLQPEITAKFEKTLNEEVAPHLKMKGFTDRRINAYNKCASQVMYEVGRRRLIEPDADEAHKNWDTQANKNCLDAGG